MGHLEAFSIFAISTLDPKPNSSKENSLTKLKTLTFVLNAYIQNIKFYFVMYR